MRRVPPERDSSMSTLERWALLICQGPWRAWAQLHWRPVDSLQLFRPRSHSLVTNKGSSAYPAMIWSG